MSDSIQLSQLKNKQATTTEGNHLGSVTDVKCKGQELSSVVITPSSNTERNLLAQFEQTGDSFRVPVENVSSVSDQLVLSF
jgi:sporulation protein YlmC with PRC-barrel domain